MNTAFPKLISTYWRSILWFFIISILLFIPGSKLPKQEIFQIPGLDKIIHFGLFLILEWLLLFDSAIKKANDNLIDVLKISLTAVVFAVLTELIQRYLISERIGDINDLCMDLIGLFVGVLSYPIFYRIISRFFPLKS
jgi:VanZ family protein